jgi:hypothetical protein
MARMAFPASTSRPEPVTTLASMGLFRRREDPMAPLAAQLTELDRRIAAAQFENADLKARLGALESKPLPAPVVMPNEDDLVLRVRTLLGEPPPTVDPRRIEALEAARDRLELRLAELSCALTDQLSELGGELDTAEHATAGRLADLERRLNELTASLPAAERSDQQPTAEELEELRNNQVRIANELARFSIAVREEMAGLASLVPAGRR